LTILQKQEENMTLTGTGNIGIMANCALLLQVRIIIFSVHLTRHTKQVH